MTRTPTAPPMILIKSIDFTFNVKQSMPDSDHEHRLEGLIRKEGLTTPIKVSKSKRPGRYDLIGGSTRIKIMKKFHSKHVSIRFAGTGAFIPVDKIPAIGTESQVPEQDAMFDAVVDNWGQREMTPQDMGAHLYEIVKRFYPEYYSMKWTRERRVMTQSLGERLKVDEKRVYEWLRAYEDASPELKKSLQEKRIGARHGLIISKLHDPHLQKMALNRVESTKANVKKTQEFVDGLKLIEKRVPSATPDERDEAIRRYETENIKRQGEQTAFQDLQDMPFMKPVHLNVKSLTCPPGRITLSYFPCPWQHLTDDEKKRCDGYVKGQGKWIKKNPACTKREEHFNLHDWSPKITLWVPKARSGDVIKELLAEIQKGLNTKTEAVASTSA